MGGCTLGFGGLLPRASAADLAATDGTGTCIIILIIVLVIAIML